MLRPSRAVVAAVLLAAMSVLWGFWLEPASLRVAERELRLPWPGGRPLRVAVLTDLHVGAPYHGLGRLRTTVDRANETGADLICLLGDLVTRGVIGGSPVPPEAIAAELGRLRAPAGVVAVMGNHDRSLDGPRVQRALEENGIAVLEDTAIKVRTPSGPLWIAGVSDYWTGPHDVGRALAAVTDRAGPVIVITHNPDIFPTVPAGVLLTIAGHTHGGQVRLPFIGAPIVPSRYWQRYTAGEIVENGRRLFVATGVGTSFLPVRLGVPPAIVVLTLTEGPG
jgi:predicted MPP superfamily phosphohydrolase